MWECSPIGAFFAIIIMNLIVFHFFACPPTTSKVRSCQVWTFNLDSLLFVYFYASIGGKFVEFFISNFCEVFFYVLQISKSFRCCIVGKIQPWLQPFFVGFDKISVGFYVFLKLNHHNFEFVSKVGVLSFSVFGMWRTLCL